MPESRLTFDLRRFLHRRLTAEQAREEIARRLRQRERAFLRLMQRTVYGRARSPYRALLRHVGITHADLSRWVARDGLEATLEQLFDAGVHVTADEFKGRVPIRRPGLELPVAARDFDNPLIAALYEVKTSGSSGPATPVSIDFRLLAHEAAYLHHFLEGFVLRARPVAAWRGVPPVASGINMLLRYARLGLRVERWFAQNRLPEGPDTAASIQFTRDLLDASRRLGWPLPAPEYVHQDDAVTIARWLAEQCAAGRPVQLDTNASSGVRVCLAALEHDVDIAGTFFRLGGEPYTPAKAAVIRQAGCQAATHYSTTEASHLGIACAAPEHVDEVHLLTDKFAVLQHGMPDPGTGAGPASTARGPGAGGGALLFTTLLPSAPRIMLNVDSGDYGEVRRRDCGCPLGALGLDLHLSQLRSHEKFTSEGLSYLRGDLTPLVEQVLPGRFGGHSADYQLVEVETGGMPYVEVVVSPRVGPIDEAAVARTVYDWLRARPGEQLLADFWEDARTVRVSRRAPYATSSAKVLPLHRMRDEG
jgi:hypothetical protein